MNKKSKGLFTEAIQQAILQHLGVNEQECESLDGFESILFKVQLRGHPCVLRISHSLRRTPMQVRGEVEWMRFLLEQGVRVPEPLLLPSGDYILPVSDGDGGSFSVVCFAWAEGQHVSAFKDSPWSTPLFKKMGAMTGKMHRLARLFAFKHDCSERPHWYEESEMDTCQFLPESDAAIAQKLVAINDRLKQIVHTSADYGLIHFDFHAGNFFLNNGRITLFDFDDCQYHLFVADIAIALFYAIPFGQSEGQQKADAKVFFDGFIRGYLTESRIDRKWMALVPALLKQREIELYAAIHRSCDVSDPASLGEWATSFLDGRRERILSDRAVVELDFGEIFDEVTGEKTTCA